MAFETMNGKYYRTAMDDIKSTEGWFKKILLLGLVYLIPIFGQIVVNGYAYEWAHKAAWNVKTPLPKKIFGRTNSKMYRWGWFVLVISFVMMLIPEIVSSVGGMLGGAATGMGTADLYSHGSYSNFHASAAAGSGIASIFGLIAFVLAFAAIFFIWVGSMRMTMYNRLGAGFQFKQIWKMMSHDFGGLMRVFGLNILFGLIGAIILSIIIGIVAMIFGASAFMTLGASYSSSHVGSYEMAMIIVALVVALLPLFLVVGYCYSVYSVFVELLTTRALGYWTRQFDVAQWGKDTDDLPFERAGASAVATPVAPAGGQPQQPTATVNGQPQQPVATVNGQPQQPTATVNGQPQQPVAPTEPQPAEPAASTAAPAEPATIEVEPVVEDVTTEAPAAEPEAPAAEPEAPAAETMEAPAVDAAEAPKEDEGK